MKVIEQLKDVVSAAKTQAQSGVLQWSGAYVSRAVNQVVKLSGEDTQPSPEMRQGMIDVFTDFEKSPKGLATHVKNTLALFAPAVPKSWNDLKEIKVKSASVLVSEAKKRGSSSKTKR
jgi:hypothetical protein